MNSAYRKMARQMRGKCYTYIYGVENKKPTAVLPLV
jgi:hypothetical protein